VVDRQGLPLSVTLSGANVPDGKKMLEAVDAINPVRGRRGQPRRRPAKLHADKAYDDRVLRQELRRRGITPRLARRGIEGSVRPGRYRWVVERTIGWQQGFRRLRVRDEKRDDIHEALVHPANSMSCWGRINGHFC